MRHLLLLAVSLTSALAFAEVVKPENTIKEAKGTTVVEGVSFEYMVLDRGWLLRASFEGGQTHYSGEKSFLMTYESEKKADIKESLPAAMFADASAKCQELGDIEFKAQTKEFSEKFKKKFKAEIVNHREEKMKEESKAWGSFVCLVSINIDG